MNQNWPPNYTEVFQERQSNYLQIAGNPDLMFGANEYYRDKPAEFIKDWVMTYDPRNVSKQLPTSLPFIPFDRQEDLIEFIIECIDTRESGLIEKCRDMGATWILCGLSVWLWLFVDGVAVGWGSRKQDLVDRIGDPSSIFEKLRMIIDGLPSFFLPEGFNPKIHSSQMKIINPKTGATIVGEIGDDIGRGGRTSVYFVDEAAHLERPEKIEASLSENTDVRIDLSSVKGIGNVFHRRREAGEVWEKGKDIETGMVRVFIMDWRDHPLKDQAWYDKKDKKAEREGLKHIFAQEVDRDYSAAVEGIIIPSEWVKAAIDAHIKLGFSDIGKITGALDVADNGLDKNALSFRKGVILNSLDFWGYAADPGVSANKAVSACRENKTSELYYDCIGIGAGVKTETNRLKREGLLPATLKIIKWDAGAAVLYPNDTIIPNDPESPFNKDFYANLKAQAWWQLRARFYKTFQMIDQYNKKTADIIYDVSELISIPANMKNRHQLVKELSQPVYKHDGSNRIIVDKKPEGTKSPNLADSVVMNYWPPKRRIKVLI